MWLAEIWRYPVKSMAGERLREVALGPKGIPGDRAIQVIEERTGRIITSRTRPRLLGHHAVIGPDGEPQVDGQPWQSPAISRAVKTAVGAAASLVRSESLDRFDVLPLLVATDGAIAAFGYDHRRLRPNLVIGGVSGLDERAWEGRTLQVGGARIGVQDLRQRCIMTTFDPDTLSQDVGVLRHIRQTFGGALALNCFVESGGDIQEGDPVTLLP